MSYDEILLDDGEIIYIGNANELDYKNGPIQASGRDVINKLNIDLDRETAKIGKFLKQLRMGIQNGMSEIQPTQIELEVGLEFSQSVGCFLVSGDVASKVTVKLIWEE